MSGVVIGVDESEGAGGALRWAVEYGKRRHEPVVALMAWSFRDQHHLDPHAPFERDYGFLQARRDLNAIVERALKGTSADIERHPVSGSAATVLIDASRDASLVVVGARGMGGFKGLLVGSVSREVLHRSHAPVAIVPDAVVDTDGPVVVGVDRFPTSRRALAWGLEEARSRRCRLIALHAWDMSGLGGVCSSAHLAPGAMRDEAARLLERELDHADTSGVVVETRLDVGSPAAALVAASATASVTVVGSRGHRPLTGLLLGSVTDQVSHHAHSAVVVVPASASAEPR